MADKDMGVIGFNAGRQRKRAARMLAAKLDFDDLTELLNSLLDKEIERYFPEEAQAIRAEEQKEQPHPKARGRRKSKELAHP